MCWSGKSIIDVLEWENIVDVLEREIVVGIRDRGNTGVLSRELGCAVVGRDIIGWSGKLCVVLLMCCSGKC